MLMCENEQLFTSVLVQSGNVANPQTICYYDVAIQTNHEQFLQERMVALLDDNILPAKAIMRSYLLQLLTKRDWIDHVWIGRLSL